MYIVFVITCIFYLLFSLSCMQVAQGFVQVRADIEAATATQSRPLYFASAHGHVDVARELIHASADLEASPSSKQI